MTKIDPKFMVVSKVFLRGLIMAQIDALRRQAVAYKADPYFVAMEIFNLKQKLR